MAILQHSSEIGLRKRVFFLHFSSWQSTSVVGAQFFCLLDVNFELIMQVCLNFDEVWLLTQVSEAKYFSRALNSATLCTPLTISSSFLNSTSFLSAKFTIRFEVLEISSKISSVILFLQNISKPLFSEKRKIKIQHCNKLKLVVNFLSKIVRYQV